MGISADIMLERARLRSRNRKWRVISIALLIMLLIVATQRFTLELSGFENHIARVELKGLITLDDEVINSLKSIKDNGAIKAVIVRMDSPGGTSVGGEAIYDAMIELSAVKPVAVVMENLATSAAYLAALPADYIIARRSSITGSIGAMIQVPNVQGLSEKVGIDLEIIKTGKNKGEPTFVDPITPENRIILQGLVDDFYEVFKAKVVQHRDIKGSTSLAQITDGRVFTGRQAVKLGLIDAIGGEQEAKSWLITEKKLPKDIKIRDVKLKAELQLLEKLLQGQALSNILIPKEFSLDGMLSIWQNNVIN